jgi:type II secretory pathway pseudopilin PulG
MRDGDRKLLSRCGRLAHPALRCGMITLWAMVTLVIIGGLLASTTTHQLRLRHQQKQWIEQRQRFWLVWSALERARTRLASDPEYRGDDWTPSPAGFQPEEIATRNVTLNVTVVDEHQQWRIRITVKSQKPTEDPSVPKQYQTEFLLEKVAVSH